jgi:hypothetical protein
MQVPCALGTLTAWRRERIDQLRRISRIGGRIFGAIFLPSHLPVRLKADTTELTGWLTMNNANFPATDDLLHRICAEYAEMPGLRVTQNQAQRLWGLDASTCRHALDCLVDVKFLTVTPSGHYARLSEGPVRKTSLQKAGAILRDRQLPQRAG